MMNGLLSCLNCYTNNRVVLILWFLICIHTFSHFNPAMADDDYLALGNAIGKLQTLPVLFVGRTDSADLTAE